MIPRRLRFLHVKFCGPQTNAVNKGIAKVKNNQRINDYASAASGDHAQTNGCGNGNMVAV